MPVVVQGSNTVAMLETVHVDLGQDNGHAHGCMPVVVQGPQQAPNTSSHVEAANT